MGAFPSRFLELYAKALDGGAEVTLESLISDLELSSVPHTLDQIQLVKDRIAECKLELTPDTTSGDLRTTRLLRSVSKPKLIPEVAISEIVRGETTNQELKSSLIYHHKRAAVQPETPLEQLKSEDVAFSCLRTIGAFLSSFSGVLYVGVDDQGRCVGIEYDFRLLTKDKRDTDGWELHLRDLIQGRFRDGNLINDYVKVEFVQVEGRTLARVHVLRRKRLSLLNTPEGYKLFRRQGNRSVEVKMEDIEEFLEFRRTQSET